MSIAKVSRLLGIGFVLVVVSLVAGCTNNTGTKTCRGTSLTIKEKVDAKTNVRIVCVCDPDGCCCGPIGGGCTWD
jgi:hypothetical protein